MLSDASGVLGFVKPPQPDLEIRWAGFVERDAVLVFCGGRFYRAATPEDAVEGKFEAVAQINADITMMVSAGSHVLAAVPSAGPLFESHDSARTFQRVNRPGNGPIGGLGVRTDGAAVLAIEVLPPEGFHSAVAEAMVFTQLPHAGVRAGPKIVKREYFVHQHGDAILVSAGDEPWKAKLVGLDAEGRWIPTDWPDPWLDIATPNLTFEPSVERDRPGFPVAPRNESERETGWTMTAGWSGSGLRGEHACRMGECLKKRKPVWPTARAFDDGQCDKASGLLKTEEWTHVSLDGTDGQQYMRRRRVCDSSRPLTRGATVLLARDRLVKLPTSCRSGWVTGNETAFVYCDSDRGAAAVLRVTEKGLVELTSSRVPAHLKLLGAEVEGDGTAVSFTNDGVWLCKPVERSCTRIEGDRIVAARPLLAGRALVARLGQRDDELRLEVAGDPNRTRVALNVRADVVDLEVTEEGHVRLWLRDAGVVRAVLVHVDGTLESM